jgi:hypothetical protein
MKLFHIRGIQSKKEAYVFAPDSLTAYQLVMGG